MRYILDITRNEMFDRVRIEQGLSLHKLKEAASAKGLLIGNSHSQCIHNWEDD